MDRVASRATLVFSGMDALPNSLAYSLILPRTVIQERRSDLEWFLKRWSVSLHQRGICLRSLLRGCSFLTRRTPRWDSNALRTVAWMFRR